MRRAGCRGDQPRFTRGSLILARQLAGSQESEFVIGRRQLRHDPSRAVGQAGTYQDTELPFDASFQRTGLDSGGYLIELELGEQCLGRAATRKHFELLPAVGIAHGSFARQVWACALYRISEILLLHIGQYSQHGAGCSSTAPA